MFVIKTFQFQAKNNVKVQALPVRRRYPLCENMCLLCACIIKVLTICLYSPSCCSSLKMSDAESEKPIWRASSQKHLQPYSSSNDTVPSRSTLRSLYQSAQQHQQTVHLKKQFYIGRILAWFSVSVNGIYFH